MIKKKRHLYSASTRQIGLCSLVSLVQSFPAARLIGWLICSRLNLKQNRSVTHFPGEPDKTEHEILIASLCDDGTKPKKKKRKKSLDPNKSTIVKTAA